MVCPSASCCCEKNGFTGETDRLKLKTGTYFPMNWYLNLNKTCSVSFTSIDRESFVCIISIS